MPVFTPGCVVFALNMPFDHDMPFFDIFITQSPCLARPSSDTGLEGPVKISACGEGTNQKKPSAGRASPAKPCKPGGESSGRKVPPQYFSTALCLLLFR